MELIDWVSAVLVASYCAVVIAAAWREPERPWIERGKWWRRREWKKARKANG